MGYSLLNYLMIVDGFTCLIWRTLHRWQYEGGLIKKNLNNLINMHDIVKKNRIGAGPPRLCISKSAVFILKSLMKSAN